MTTEQTSLQKKLAARKPHRETIDLPADMFPGIEGGKVVFEILRSGKSADTLVQAFGLRDKDAKKHPAMADHAGHFNGLHVITQLHAALRDVDKPDEMPAFVSPEWMQQYLHNHEITTLINIYNKLVAKIYPGGIEKLDSTEKLVDFARMIAAQWKTDLPDVALANFSHEVLAECFIRMCCIWSDLSQENETIRGENLSLRAAGVVPKEEEAAVEHGELSIYAVRLLAETAQSTQGDLVAAAANDITTRQQAIVAMRMLGWVDTSASWKRVIADV
jgi:hypothetical protein